MAFTEQVISSPNFLASEVGLRTVTYTFDASNENVVTEKDVHGCTHKVIKAGTIYPANDATVKGIVFTDVDVTNGNRPGSLMVAGRVLKEATLSAGVNAEPSATAIPVLQAQGLYAETTPKTTLPADTIE